MSAQTAAPGAPSAAGDGDSLYTCGSCSVAFYTAPEQREHFRSDLHRYNMKRRVADLAPVTAQVFHSKAQEHRGAAADAAPVAAADTDSGRKSFSTANAYRDHLNSRRHKDNVQKTPPTSEHGAAGRTQVSATPLGRVGALRDALPDPSPETATADSDADDASLDDNARMERMADRKIARARRIDPAATCMFCALPQDSLDKSYEHMATAHGFFIPEQKYLVDRAGLLQYLADKVAIGNVCLWCNGRGRSFPDVTAVQQHMLDKAHCKVAYESSEDQLEFSDFYDFRSSYPDYGGTGRDDAWEDLDEDAGAGDGDVVWESASDDDDDDAPPPPTNGIRYGDTDLELVLPSGARLGHRSLQRYYRQSLWQTPAAQGRAASAQNGRALAHRLAAGTRGRDLVVSGRGGQEVAARNRGEAREATRHVREFRDMQRREQFKTKVGFRHNNQKHFRDPLLQ
ncbi:pre-60S factor rei1 [Malassezia sp. CBS 17886]|nr:pre-60S factor rei1 [Malassezia sp. CBS 17886]